jgi:hypothetical protein
VRQRWSWIQLSQRVTTIRNENCFHYIQKQSVFMREVVAVLEHLLEPVDWWLAVSGKEVCICAEV